MTTLYENLDADRRLAVRAQVEKPAVRFWSPDDSGAMRDFHQERELHLLERLEAGVFVGAVTEKQIKRKPGDTAL